MPPLPTSVLPKRIPHGPHKPSSAIQVSPLLLEAAGSEPEAVLLKLHTSKDGLSRTEAERRLQEYGPNIVAREEGHPRLHLLGKALINPLVILLLVLAAASFLTGDFRAGGVMLLMVVLGVVLRFVQEARADTAAAKLRAMIIHVIRTNRIPFLQSWASWPLIVTTAVIMLLGAWLPFSPIGPAFGFTPLPPLYWPLLAVTLLGYVLLTQTVKTWLFRKGWVSE